MKNVLPASTVLSISLNPIAVPKPKSYHFNRMNQGTFKKNFFSKIEDSVFEGQRSSTHMRTLDPNLINVSLSIYHLKVHLIRCKLI